MTGGKRTIQIKEGTPDTPTKKKACRCGLEDGSHFKVLLDGEDGNIKEDLTGSINGNAHQVLTEQNR